MPWDTKINPVIEALCYAIDDTKEIKMIVDLAGLDLAHLPYASTPINFWTAVLNRAFIEGRVDEVLEAALRRRDDPRLRRTIEDYRQERGRSRAPAETESLRGNQDGKEGGTSAESLPSDKWIYSAGETLASEIGDLDSIRAIVLRSGLPIEMLPGEPTTPIDYWYAALKLALRQGRFVQLLESASLGAGAKLQEVISILQREQPGRRAGDQRAPASAVASETVAGVGPVLHPAELSVDLTAEQRPRRGPPLLAGAAADTVPEPGDGRVRTADRLGAAAEVEMLVSVLLAKDTPLPLAVGLFGDWGSGKSFFMALMYERIYELADLAKDGRPEAEPFCSQVRQVRFNAWHYVDANLWASLAVTLFDELAGADQPDRAQAKLTELDKARQDATDARTRRAELQEQVRDLEAKAGRPASAAAVSVSTAIRAVRDKPLMDDLKAARREGDVDADVVRLVSALGEIDSAARVTLSAWQVFREEVLHRRRWVTWAALLVFIGAAAAASVGAGLSVGANLLTVVGGLLAGLSPALAGALRVLYLAREARQARELPLVRKQDELAQAQAAEERAEQEVTRRRQEFDELRDQGLQLQRFVRERAASSDYRAKLGVISQVRRDFEQLVELIPGGKPAAADKAAAVHAAMRTRVPDLDRIVLYIDDLDRCPHDKVVEVLQAVHLLLAFKLFVVVVGVDSRWLERSLREHYRNLLEEPDSYLEKIFQIPYTLRPMSQSTYRDLIGELTPQAGRLSQPPSSSDHGDVPPASTRGPGNANIPGDLSARHDAETGDLGTVTISGASPEGKFDDISAPEPVLEPPLPRPEALFISDAEREMLGRLWAIVQTPRAVKRLVNIYRMLRVSVPEDELESFHPGRGDEYQAVVLLLGILVGRPSDAPAVFSALMEADDGDEIWQVFARFDGLSEQLSRLRDIRVGTAGPYRHWAPRVSRFSFRLATVIPAR
jgi:hypothetical protein